MATNNHCTIMQRTRRVEDTHQQVVTELCIELVAGVSHVLQTHITFDNNQRSGFSRCKRGRSENYFVVNTFAKLSDMPRKRHAKAIAKRNQSLSNFRLEENDDRDADVQQSVTENKLESREILFD